MKVMRWLLLGVAFLFVVTGLFNVFVAPLWIPWQWRTGIAVMVSERGYRYVLWPVVVALLAWLVRGDRRGVTFATFAGCGLALALGLKPLAQAGWLGRHLPAQLQAAFGPAAVDRAPFSLAQMRAPLPEPVEPRVMKYAGPLQLEFFRAIGRSPAPCVITLHGGGWFSGNHRDRRPYISWLARHGYAVATIDYGRIPEARWPFQKHAVLAALDFLHAKADELGIDRRKFVLLGRSAGSQLALVGGYATHDRDVVGVIDFYGPNDIAGLYATGANHPDRFLTGLTGRQVVETYLGGTPTTARANYDAASGLLLADEHSPPTLLVHGGLDSMMPLSESQNLAAKLTKLGRPNTLVSPPWAAHGFDTLDFDGPGGQISLFAIAWFLAAVTR